MSHKTAKIVIYKFLNMTKSDREGGRTVGSGRAFRVCFPMYFFNTDDKGKQQLYVLAAVSILL
jgi:hypothetical protein